MPQASITLTLTPSDAANLRSLLVLTNGPTELWVDEALRLYHLIGDAVVLSGARTVN